MLDDDYSCFDFLKFYYNVKLEYKPKKRNIITPLAFLLTAVCSLIIFHGLLVYKYDYFYFVEGAIIGFMILLYLSLLVGPKM